MERCLMSDLGMSDFIRLSLFKKIEIDPLSL